MTCWAADMLGNSSRIIQIALSTHDVRKGRTKQIPSAKHDLDLAQIMQNAGGSSLKDIQQ